MASKIAKEDKPHTLRRHPWISLTLVYLLIPLILGITGLDIGWWQAWLYSILIIAVGVGGRYAAEHRHPGLMAERVKFEDASNVKSWDKVLAPLSAISVGFPLFFVAGFDHQFGWSPVFPVWLNILGLSVCLLGYAFSVWALLENRFFSSVVRIQLDRGHVVCDTGPYRIIRHPGYAGNIIAVWGVVLALGSLWTIIPATVALIILVLRTALEDRALQEDLPGYRDYAQQTRYRLLPGVW